MKCIICETKVQKQKELNTIENTCTNCKKHIVNFIKKSESELIEKINALH